MKNTIFTGAGVAIVTPMNQDGSVNFDKLGELIEEQIAGKTDAIIICGTTGESSTLSHEEHLECIKYAVEKTAKRIPVVAGTGSNSTETAIYLSKTSDTTRKKYKGTVDHERCSNADRNCFIISPIRGI